MSKHLKIGFSDAVDQWAAGQAWAPRTRYMVTLMYSVWRSVLRNLPLQDIRPISVELVRRTVAAKVCASWQNMHRQKFRMFWRWAMDLELVDHDPTRVWKSVPTGRLRAELNMANHEFHNMMTHIKLRSRRFVLFARLTGARYGTLKRLVWAEVDLPGARLSVPAEKMKMKRAWTVPLCRAAVVALGESGGPDALVFPELPHYRAVLRDIKEAARLAKLPYAEELSPHQLRRTFACKGLEAGLTPREVADLGAWKDPKVMLTFYGACTPTDRARDLVARIEPGAAHGRPAGAESAEQQEQQD